VVQSLLAATLLGYAYMLAGAWLIDQRRTIQYAHLVFRAVELGMVGVAAMAAGIGTRLVLRQRLALCGEVPQRVGRQYHLGELMFLIVVFAVGLGLVNLFFDHVDRETQLADILLAIARAFPAALPWLWGVMQPKLTIPALAVIVGLTLGLLLVKAAFDYTLTGDELAAILPQVTRRAAAYAAAATLNGLSLRALGFRWQSG
jgi:hypothetical protein